MKKIAFYIITNALYTMSVELYVRHIKTKIFKQEWFKQACRKKEITISYLSKDFAKKSRYDVYMIVEDDVVLYAHKLLLIKFHSASSTHPLPIKLFHINLKNETLFHFTLLLFELQRVFVQTHHYKDLQFLRRETLVALYISRFNHYLDLSLLSKIINNNAILLEKKRHPLSLLVPKKSFLYSCYIKDIIHSDPIRMSDARISQMLQQHYGVVLTRREVCFIRKRYFIPKMNQRENIDFYILNEKLFSVKKMLLKEEISLLEKTKGIYELSSAKQENYTLKKSPIVYIGSSKDIKKRLFSYVANLAHTESFRNYKIQNVLYFRYIATANYKEYEMLFINAFLATYGDLPLLNKQRVLRIPCDIKIF